MTVSDLANNPVTFTLSKKDYRVKRLNLMELFGEFEVLIKRKYMDDIVELASRIKDSKEKVEFQRRALQDMPSGKRMEELINENMSTFEGGVKLLHLALNKCQTVDMEEVRNLIVEPSNQLEITNIMSYIVGNDVIKEEKKEVPEGATVIEKKTA